MKDVEIERQRARFLLCRKSLSKAKFDVSFWSRELRLVTEELVRIDQLCFDFFNKTLSQEESGEDDGQIQEAVVC